jgi:hypothetical protein
LSCVKKYLSLIEAGPIDHTILKSVYSAWTFNFINNKLKDFIFKFTNNYLGLNIRIVHFTDRIERGCTFCTLKQIRDTPDETFFHLFYSCDVTKKILEKFFNTYFTDLGLDAVQKQKFWFGVATLPVHVTDKNMLMLSIFFIQSQIWESKLRGKLPSYNSINIELKRFIWEATLANKNFCTGDNAFLLSRNWHTLSQDVLH